MAQNDQDIVLVPPGYDLTIEIDASRPLNVIFLDSVDGDIIDEENYNNAHKDMDALSLPNGFKDYAA